MDGLRPDLVNAQTMPTLAALAGRGVESLAHRTVYPSETRGALTALATGARPETTGVLGNEFFARGAQRGLTRTNTIHDWRAAEALLPGGMVGATSLAETLHKAGRSLAVVTSSGQGSVTALAWEGERFGAASFNVRHPHLAYPSTLAADIEQRHGVPPTGWGAGGEMAAVEVFARSVWPARRPAATILWVTEVDSASHRYGLGSERMLASMAACDAALARLLDWRDAEPDRDAITLMVTSDHGHATIGGFVSASQALAEAGLALDPEHVVARRGRAPAFWLRGARDAGRLNAMAQALAAQPWCGALFSAPTEPGSVEGVLPGTLSVALTGAGHRRAPDLLAHLAGDADENAHGVPGVGFADSDGHYGTPLGGGTHGGMSPAELNAVLVGEGAGLAAGRRVASRTGIQDLAPTILRLLGVAAPPSMTGRVLEELLDGGDAAPAPSAFALEATADGRTSRLRLCRVDGQVYVDAAEHEIAGAPQAAPVRRDALRVAPAS